MPNNISSTRGGISHKEMQRCFGPEHFLCFLHCWHGLALFSSHFKCPSLWGSQRQFTHARRFSSRHPPALPPAALPPSPSGPGISASLLSHFLLSWLPAIMQVVSLRYFLLQSSWHSYCLEGYLSLSILISSSKPMICLFSCSASELICNHSVLVSQYVNFSLLLLSLIPLSFAAVCCFLLRLIPFSKLFILKLFHFPSLMRTQLILLDLVSKAEKLCVPANKTKIILKKSYWNLQQNV